MAWKTNPQGLMRRANREFGDWLSRVEWDWFVTLTFKADYVSPKQADKAFYSWFNTVRLCAKVKGLTPSCYGPAAPFYFRVTEYQDRGSLHYHALVGGVGDTRRLLLKDFWEWNGHARVEAYESGKGANYYVGKYITKGEDEIRFSNNLAKNLTLLDTS
ncbi:hypothetical protein ES705_44572 [subsurface metagenome]